MVLIYNCGCQKIKCSVSIHTPSVLYWFFHEPRWFFEGFKVTGTSGYKHDLIIFLVKYVVEENVLLQVFFIKYLKTGRY
jgi:hypothetical protein